MARDLQFGRVILRSVDPNVTLRARLGVDRPNVEAGYGGWAEVPRPRRRPLTVWEGAPALRMTLPLLFDQHADGTSVERQLAQLERLATATASDGEPPRVRFSSRGAAVPHQTAVWVIEALAWGDAIANRAGNRTRQYVTPSLLEWIRDVRVREDSPAKRWRVAEQRSKTKAGAANKRLVAASGRRPPTDATLLTVATAFGAGDDLLSIAARELGDADRWVEIAQLNGIRDPRSIAPGQVIRLP